MGAVISLQAIIISWRLNKKSIVVDSNDEYMYIIDNDSDENERGSVIS